MEYELSIQQGNDFPVEFGFAIIDDGITQSNNFEGSIIYDPNPNLMIKKLNLFVYADHNYFLTSLSDISFNTHISVIQYLEEDDEGVIIIGEES